MKPQVPSLLVDPAGKGVRSNRAGLIREREGKQFYHSEKPDLIIQEFSSNGTEDGKKHSRPKELSALRNEISSYLFEYVAGFHIPTHFVSMPSEIKMLVRQIELIPLKLKIYNWASPALAARFGLKEGELLEFPIIEHFYVDDLRTATWVNEYHVYALGVATPEEFKQMNRMASKTNAVLRGLCDRRRLMVADLQLEFGRYKGQILLGDELSPSTCHFCDMATENKVASDRFLPEHENAVQMFAELRDRLKMKV